MNFLVATTAVIAFLAAAYGWGSVLARWSHAKTPLHWSYQAALGMTLWAVIGATLNMAEMAYPIALNGMVAMGLLLTVATHRPLLTHPGNAFRKLARTLGSGPWWLREGLPLALLLGAVGFSIYTLMPSIVFNHHDDLHTYLGRPVRMLQTGTFGGNPFDFMGIDSLGAQALFQGILLAGLPMKFINGFDAVICLALAGFLLIGIARQLDVAPIYPSMAIITLLMINPQTVNISTVYSGTAMTLALVMSCLLLAPHLTAGASGVWRRAVPVGLCLATLIALKITVAVAGGLFCLAFFSLAACSRKDWKASLRTGSFTAGITILALLPWLGVHRVNFTQAVLQKLADHPPDPASAGSMSTRGDLTALLTATHKLLYYGSSALAHHMATVTVLLAGVLYLIRLIRNINPKQRHQHLVGAAAGVAGVATYLLIGYLFYPISALRYTCPTFLALLPLALLLLGARFGSGLATTHTATAPLRHGVATVMTIILVLLFSSATVSRAKAALEWHTAVRYPLNDNTYRYLVHSFNPVVRDALQQYQARTQADTTVLAWVSMPANLDYTRNHIIPVSEAGLTSPWLTLPNPDDTTRSRAYLADLGVRYVLWEHDGFGMKKSAEHQKERHSPFPLIRRNATRNLAFMRMLTTLSKHSRVVFQTEDFILYDIGADPETSAPDPS